MTQQKNEHNNKERNDGVGNHGSASGNNIKKTKQNKKESK